MICCSGWILLFDPPCVICLATLVKVEIVCGCQAYIPSCGWVGTRVGLLLAVRVVYLLSHCLSKHKRRFVLVVIGLVGVAVFVFVSIRFVAVVGF